MTELELILDEMDAICQKQRSLIECGLGQSEQRQFDLLQAMFENCERMAALMRHSTGSGPATPTYNPAAWPKPLRPT